MNSGLKLPFMVDSTLRGTRCAALSLMQADHVGRFRQIVERHKWARRITQGRAVLFDCPKPQGRRQSGRRAADPARVDNAEGQVLRLESGERLSVARRMLRSIKVTWRSGGLMVVLVLILPPQICRQRDEVSTKSEG